jgi:hypothetical protein
MLDNAWATARCYYSFYGQFFSSQWAHMTPLKYGTLLIGVGVFGWLLMKSANKRN